MALEQEFLNYARDDGGNVSVPRRLRAGRNTSDVELAYITPEEQGILAALRPGTPHRGPMDIPNYDDIDVATGGYRGSEQLDYGGGTTAFGPSSVTGQGGAGVSPDIAAFNKAQWQQKNIPYGQRNIPGQRGQGFFGGLRQGLGNITSRLGDWFRNKYPRRGDPTTLNALGSYYTDEERYDRQMKAFREKYGKKPVDASGLFDERQTDATQDMIYPEKKPFVPPASEYEETLTPYLGAGDDLRKYSSQMYPKGSSLKLFTDREGVFSPKMQTKNQDNYYRAIQGLIDRDYMGSYDPTGPLSKPEDRGEPYINQNRSEELVPTEYIPSYDLTDAQLADKERWANWTPNESQQNIIDRNKAYASLIGQPTYSSEDISGLTRTGTWQDQMGGTNIGDFKEAKGTTWAEFMQDKSRNAMVRPGDKSWKDVYYRWLDINKMSQGGRVGYKTGGRVGILAAF